MLYEWRKVDGGRESYDESNQSVRIIRDAEDKEDVEIMNADEVSPALWTLRKCAQTKCAGEGEFLMATVKDSQRYRRRRLHRLRRGSETRALVAHLRAKAHPRVARTTPSIMAYNSKQSS